MKRIMDRVETHTHSDYSNLTGPDSMNKVKKLVKKAMDMGLRGIAITDHETLSAHIEAMEVISNIKNDLRKELEKLDPIKDRILIERINKKLEFKVLYGNEIYLTRENLNRETVEKGEKYNHLILIAKNKKGHKQLRELSTIAWKRAFMFGVERRPTWQSDIEKIIGNDKGNVICTTACLGSYLGKIYKDFVEGTLTKKELEEETLNFINWGKEIFGDDFYLEAQPGMYTEQVGYNAFIFASARKFNVKTTIACDVHYLSKDDRRIHKAFLKSKEAEREVDAFYQYTYLMTNEEIYQSMNNFPEEIITQSLINTIEIGNKCEEYDIFNTPKIPARPISKEDLIEIKFMHEYENRPYLNGLANSEDIQNIFFINQIEKGMLEKIKKEEYQKHFDRLEIEAREFVEISKILGDNMIQYPNLMQMVIDIAWDEGDSFVGPSRGSAFGFLTHYLMGITNISPFFEENIPAPHWRFLSKDRSAGLPDVDVDVQSDKRGRILQVLEKKYESLGGACIQVATFKEEGSRSAVATAARGLGYDHETALFLSSLIINERGFNRTLSEMYYGNEEKGMKPTQQFIDEIDKYPELFETALGIEGLVTGRGIHACGVVITNDEFTNSCAIMRAPNGALISQYNLSQLEKIGLVKFDLLSVEILTRQRFAFDLLLKHNKIEWQGNLKKTYNKYLGIDAIDLKDETLWALIKENKINALFQWDSPVGKQAIKAIQPENIVELTAGNSLLRLMKGEDDKESPLETFVRYKTDINEWYRDMAHFGLTQEQMKPFIEYLKPKYGVAEAQEDIMILSMQKDIAGFSLGSADKMRKIVAKKKMSEIPAFREKVILSGKESGADEIVTRYFWDVLVKRQLGYSFSILHSAAYSFVAIQCAWIVRTYGDLFWNTACLIVDSGAFNNDYYIDEELDEDEIGEQVKGKEKNTDYGAMATAIANFQKEGIKIKLPNINKSQFIFEPDLEEGAIYYGLKGIKKVNQELINEIIKNRPYASLEDFLEKVKVARTIGYSLIKSGAFDELEGKPREEIISDYSLIHAKQIKKVTLSQGKRIIDSNLVPETLNFEKSLYEFNRYIRQKLFKTEEEYYILDSRAQGYYQKFYNTDDLEVDGEMVKINRKTWESIYKKDIASLSLWIKNNNDFLLEALNNESVEDEYDSQCSGNVSSWEMDVLSFYYHEHELTPMNKEIYGIKNFFDLSEEAEIEFIYSGKFHKKRVKLERIAGTVLEKNKNRHTITLLTEDGVVMVKFHAARFAKYEKQISALDEKTGKKKILEKGWFTKGTKLLLTGYRRGDQFVVKVYGDNEIPVYKIETVNQDGTANLNSTRDMDKIVEEWY